jgi:hypothetical protein
VKLVTRAAWKRMGIALLLFCLLLAFVYPTMIRMPGKSFSGPLPELTDSERALAQTLRRDLQTLAGEIGDRNVFKPDKLQEAERFITKRLESAGYRPRRQEYTVGPTTCANIEVELPGGARKDEIVVVGAHYDTVPGCPGANDNGSGVVGTLALADALAGTTAARTLRLVLFVNEEPPHFHTDLMGSRVYARRCRERRENIIGMISLETIGYFRDEPKSQSFPVPGLGLFYPTEGNFIALVGNFGSRAWVRDAVGAFRRTAAFPCEGAALPAFIPGVGWSDHWAFFQEGFPALMVTDTAPFRYPHYHEPTDTPDRVDTERMARIVCAMERVVLDLANPD